MPAQYSPRQGAIYITALIVSLMVAAFAITTSLIAYRNQRDRVLHDDAFELASGAESAIELALARIADDTNWRINHTSGTEYGPFALGTCNIFYRLIDSSNNLSAGVGRDITIVGIARKGASSYAISITATPNGPAFTCVESSVATIGALQLSGAIHWNTSQRFYISANLNLSSGATLTGDTYVRSTGNNASSIKGNLYSNQPQLTFPTIASLESIYRQYATQIPTSNIPVLTNGSLAIDKCVISPLINPFGGGTNSRGVYLIDCGGRNITFSNCRIIGTLLLLNTGDGSRISSNTSIEPALPNYPSLITKGKLGFSTRLNVFSEATINTNLNPPEAPLYNISNTTLTETYITGVKGIVFISDDAIFDAGNELQINGAIFANRIVSTAPGTLRVFYNKLHATSPPPGFRSDSRMLPISGTYRRVPTP
jgi:hypothetical protein